MKNQHLYYRNIKELTIDGVTVDQGALWKRKQNTLILVDDDQYIEHKFNNKLFAEKNSDL